MTGQFIEAAGVRAEAAKRARRILAAILAILLLSLTAEPRAAAYSFLTHETIVDLAWEGSIKPVLLKRFPKTTPEEMRRAHAYAYGGSTIQDAGYYPFGHAIFSDLTHYVRTGDLIVFMIRDSRNVNELAFALGALSHYVGDSIGHQGAVNPATATEFPALEKKYGSSVTYEESPHAHVRTEFAFDVDQLSDARFAPSAYLHSVGLLVARRVLEQAFFETYGLRLHDVLGGESASFHSYQSSVRRVLPKLALAEVLLHGGGFPPDRPTPAFTEFDGRLNRAAQENGWNKFHRKRANFSTRMVAVGIFIVPKIGAISDLAIRGPEQETEGRYVQSVNHSVDEYSKLLRELSDSGQDGFHLANLDLDTGYVTRPGSYRLTDETYAILLNRLTRKDPYRRIPAELRQNVLSYYADPNAPITTKKNPKAWKRVQKELPLLRAKP